MRAIAGAPGPLAEVSPRSVEGAWLAHLDDVRCVDPRTEPWTEPWTETEGHLVAQAGPELREQFAEGAADDLASAIA